ncbi:hypothetical protein NDN08_003823 [Rhodosorus marinus]|uniref:C2 NT-type domain-containing protein n=1 Tax=Rhodosorus marinus TaxID=101924 RepID=A0AAV8UGJ4_9RHOD|nr:hypothetical protein NDN08_003823 [Rhodosorus marinus]
MAFGREAAPGDENDNFGSQENRSIRKFGSRLLGAGSVGNVVRLGGKTKYVYDLEVMVESVESFSGTEPVVLVIERGNESLSTTPVTSSGGRIEVEQTLSKKVTFFRPADMPDFQKKIFKMFLKDTGSNSILGKTNFDAAAYAEPEEQSMQRRLKFELSNRASVIMTITTTLLSMDRGLTESADGSVGDSGSFIPSDVGSDELAVDFDLDDEPVGAAKIGDPHGGGNSLDSRLDYLTKQKMDLEKENARLKKELASAGTFGKRIGPRIPLSSRNMYNRAGRAPDSSSAPSTVNNAEMVAENERLQAQLKELEEKIRREPGQGDLSEELRKVKASLVEIGVEKEAVETEIRALRAEQRKKRKMKKYRLG